MFSTFLIFFLFGGKREMEMLKLKLNNNCPFSKNQEKITKSLNKDLIVCKPEKSIRNNLMKAYCMNINLRK